METKYLLVTEHRLSDKNNLTKQIKDKLEANNRKVFSDLGEIKKFVKGISDKAHADHPRCKPITVQVNNSYKKGDFYIYGIGLTVNFLQFKI